MTSQEPASQPKGNGSLALLWVLAIITIAGGFIAIVSSDAVAGGMGAIGFGGLAILLALTAQAIRHEG